MKLLEPPHDKVAPVTRNPQVSLDRERPGRLDHFEFHVQRQRDRERVEPWPHVGGARGDANKAAALHRAQATGGSGYRLNRAA